MGKLEYEGNVFYRDKVDCRLVEYSDHRTPGGTAQRVHHAYHPTLSKPTRGSVVKWSPPIPTDNRNPMNSTFSLFNHSIKTINPPISRLSGTD